MNPVICPKCQVVMKPHATLREWLRCFSCSFCQLKSENLQTKEKNIMAAQKAISLNVQEYLGSTSMAELPKDIAANVKSLIEAINAVLSKFGSSRKITSGYRSIDDHHRIYNKINANRAKTGLPALKIPMGSAHLSGLAIDLEDANGDLDKWCIENIDWLTEKGVYIEHPDHTKGWCHMQLRAPKSGNNPFIP